MIYIVYGLSGPLKRYLIDSIEDNNPSNINYNKRGAFGWPLAKYDEQDITPYPSKNAIIKGCGGEYMYEHPETGTYIAINQSQLEKWGDNDDMNHIVICHDPTTINKIRKAFPNTQIVKIYCSATSTAIEVAHDKFKVPDFDKYPSPQKRRERIERLITNIEVVAEIKPNITVSEYVYSADYLHESTKIDSDYNKIKEEIYANFISKINSKWKNLLNHKRKFNTNQDEHQDDSLAFEQDFNSVINSPAFRRLQDKTQVFPLETTDYPRTRLTHTIECAAIAEELGIRAVNFIKEQPDFLQSCYKIPTILKTAALLHDMGNPPFGHQGEEIIRQWFKEYLAKKVREMEASASFSPIHNLLKQHASDKNIQERLTDLFGILGKVSFREWLDSNLEKVAASEEYESFEKTHEKDHYIIASAMKFFPSLGLGNVGEVFFRGWLERQFSIINQKESTAERGLQDFCKKEEYLCDFKYFEGNAQLLRLITCLNDIPGGGNRLNLTYATLAMIIKYPTSSLTVHMNEKQGKTDIPTSQKKPGYFTSEVTMFNKIQKNVGLQPGKRHPLTFLLEAADDIAYLSADLQDAHQKGIIQLEYIEKELLPIKYMPESLSDAKIKTEQLYTALRKKLMKDVIQAFKDHYRSIMEGSFEDELLNVSESAEIARKIRVAFKKNLYCCDSIYHSQIIAETILSKLLDVLVPAALAYKDDNVDDKNRRIIHFLSKNYKEACDVILADKKTSEADKVYCKLLLATDCICGMTDSYAQRMYNMFVTGTIP